MSQPKERKPAPSVLLVRLSSLGDIVQALPLAALLTKRGHDVSWLIESRFAALTNLVDLPVEWQIWERGWLSTQKLRKLRGRYDLVCDLQGNWKSALCSHAIGRSRAWRPARVDLRESSSAWIPSRHAAPARAPHILDRSITVLEAALETSLAEAVIPAPPFLEAGGEGRDRMRREIARLGIDPDSPFVVQVLGPERDPRTWPLPKALQLESQLQVQHFFLCGPAESSVRVDPKLSMLRQDTGGLADLVAVGNLIAQAGGMAVGHDGGAMHVLRASGAMTRFLFGPQDPARTGPYGEPVIETSEDLACKPCLRRSCELALGNLCMDKISVEVVRREVERCLDIG